MVMSSLIQRCNKKMCVSHSNRVRLLVSRTWLLCPWNSPGKNTGVGCHSLLHGIFPTQGSNPGLPHCRKILYHLSHQGISNRKVYFFLFLLINTAKKKEQLHKAKLRLLKEESRLTSDLETQGST